MTKVMLVGGGIEIITPPFPFPVDTLKQLFASDQSSLTCALELQMINPASIQTAKTSNQGGIQNNLLGCALPCQTLATETVENHYGPFFRDQASRSIVTEELPSLQRGLRFRPPSVAEGFTVGDFLEQF